MINTYFGHMMKMWWGKVVCGAILGIGSVATFVRLGHLEAGDTKEVDVDFLSKLAYNIGGRWVVLILMGGIGAGLIVWGFKQFQDERS